MWLSDGRVNSGWHPMAEGGEGGADGFISQITHFFFSTRRHHHFTTAVVIHPERPLRRCNWRNGAANSLTQLRADGLGFAVRSVELVRLKLNTHLQSNHYAVKTGRKSPAILPNYPTGLSLF